MCYKLVYCFYVKQNLNSKMENIIRDFCWGDKGQRKTFMGRYDLCRPQDEGGIAFKSLTHFNMAFLAK